MNDTELKAIRDLILCGVAKFPNGVSASMIGATLRASGFEFEKSGANSLEAQFNYLEKRKLIEAKNQAHTPSQKLYVITAEGDDYLRAEKLIA